MPTRMLCLYHQWELPMEYLYLVIPVGAVIYMAYDLGMIVGDIRKMLQRRKDGC